MYLYFINLFWVKPFSPPSPNVLLAHEWKHVLCLLKIPWIYMTAFFLMCLNLCWCWNKGVVSIRFIYCQNLNSHFSVKVRKCQTFYNIKHFIQFFLHTHTIKGIPPDVFKGVKFKATRSHQDFTGSLNLFCVFFYEWPGLGMEKIYCHVGILKYNLMTGSLKWPLKCFAC